MSRITTHILDVSRGTPAADVAVELEFSQAGAWKSISKKQTDADGRIKDLTAPGELNPGVYRLCFETGAYFQARETACFHPMVYVVFEIKDAAQHHHVPLLLSPYGYSTYRGS